MPSTGDKALSTSPNWINGLPFISADQDYTRETAPNIACQDVAAPSVRPVRSLSLAWNKLPPILRDITDRKQFRKSFKTHIFLEHAVAIKLFM
jgi:hypothetical protein